MVVLGTGTEPTGRTRFPSRMSLSADGGSWLMFRPNLMGHNSSTSLGRLIMLQGFKQFMLRGNVLDLAVAVVMGAAFGAVVTALVKDLITPLIAAIIGKPDFSAIEFTIRGSKFPIGDFINALVSFLLIGAAVYSLIVLPVNQ